MGGQLHFSFPEEQEVRTETDFAPAPIARQIHEAQVDPLRVAQIKHELDLGNSRSATLAATVLANRLISSGQELDSLAKARENPLPNPSLMKNFDIAVASIISAIRAGETIGVVGDYDVDGITSVAQFSTTLTQAGANHVWRIPNREVDGYGISHRIAKDLCHQNCRTVVLFDHGTHNHHEIALLRMSGVRVIVFDHHVVGSALPDAIVVSPAQEGCGFARHKPCASGMAFFLCHRLAEELGLPAPNPALASLGTIADMVPLVGPNRTLASVGLEALRAGAVRGVNYLAIRQGIDIASLSSSDVAFYLAPIINAQGRLGDPDKAVKLLIAKTEDELHPLASSMLRDNELRKEIQASQLSTALKSLGTQELPRALVACDQSFHQGVVGLTAQGLALRYGRPSFAFAYASDGTLRGSARAGADTYDLDAILREARQRDSQGIILKAGGHKAAAGLTIRGDSLEAFKLLLDAVMKDLYPNPPVRLEISADATLDFRSLTPKLIHNLNERLEPYGQGFEPCKFLFRDVVIKDVHELSAGRRMLFLEQNGKTQRAYIGSEQWSPEFRRGARCDLLATPTTFFSRNKRLIQLSVQALSVTTPSMTSLVTPSRPETVEPSQTPRLPKLVRDDAAESGSSRRRNTPTTADLRRRSHDEKLNLLTPFLYPDLSRFYDDPFEPRATRDPIAARAAFITAHGLTALKSDSFEFRPPQIEFCRFFLTQTKNVMLQAPTGTGKTEIALICAAQPLSKGSRVIFAAPTIEISRQTALRAAAMLDTEPVVLDGTVSPKRRDAIYRDRDPQFISALPHVLRNDIERETFTLRPSDLLIIDEGHHTSGDYPYTPLIQAANRVRARILFMSATPGQIEPGGSWEKLDDLKRLCKVEAIFPLRCLPRQLQVTSQHLNLNQDIISAIEVLGRRLRTLRAETLNYLNDQGSETLAREAKKVLGSSTLSFASGYQLDSLINRVRRMNNDGERWVAVKNLHGIGELSELYQWLAYQGISGFLLRVAEKRFECAFPTKTARGSNGRLELTAPRYLRELYSSREVQQAYNTLARGEFVGLWNTNTLENASGLSRTSWQTYSDKERRALFNDKVEATLRRLSQGLVTLNYEDHPKESFLFDQILRQHPGAQSIVYTRDRSHALFIADRLNHRFEAGAGRAVALTGLGAGTHKGISRSARRENLDRFLAGDANVLVSTSAGNEGIDFKGLRHGYVVRGTASLIDALQQWGRLRGGGRFTYLCSGPEEHGKFTTILRKEESFYRRMSEERQAILDAHRVSEEPRE